MRNIKFRMWGGIPKKYHYDVENVFNCLAQQNVYDKNMPTRGFTIGYDHISDGSVFEQFTGLHDKNGVEIYVGDEVKSLVNGEEVYGQVFYSNELCGYLFGKIDDNVELGICHSLSDEIEVIGNIHTEEKGKE